MQLSHAARLYACLFYELITHITLWFVVTFFISLFFHSEIAQNSNFLRFILWTISGWYCIYSWSHGGQTLAMKAWRFKLIPPKNQSFQFFLFRYLLTSLGALLILTFYLNILFGGKQFIHDLILKSKITYIQTS